MIEERYTDWFPVTDLPLTIFVEAAIDNYDGLKIFMKGKEEDDPILEVFFPNKIFYRNIDESYFCRTINSANKQRSSPFVLVENSQLLRWLHEESYAIYEDEDIKHYLFLTGNDCIDVLSSSQPEITWVSPDNEEFIGIAR